MNFYDVLSTHVSQDAQSHSVTIPENWGQGRATFGGLVAAVMFEKMQQHTSADRTVRSLMISFVAPVTPGELAVEVTVLRVGKGATQLQATAIQNNQVCAVILGSFGADRESIVHIPASPRISSSVAPDGVNPFPFIPNVTPDFTRYFDYRYTVGNMPFSGSTESKMGGWIRLQEEADQPASASAILALVDAWPPATFSLLKKPAAGSSLTWNISFAESSPQSAREWWQYEASIQQSANGYSHIEAQLLDKHGQPVAFSQQVVSIFA